MGIWNEVEQLELHFSADAKRKSEQLAKLKTKYIIIYGYGAVGIGAEKVCSNLGLKVEAVCDKNKIGSSSLSGKIETIEDAVMRLKDVVVLVCVRGMYEQIKEEYKELISEEDFVDGDDFYLNTPTFFSLEEHNPYVKKLEMYRSSTEMVFYAI